MFPCLACSHCHFDFDSLCSHVPDPALEPQSPARTVEVLILPVAAWCSTNLSPSLYHCLSLISNIIVCLHISQVSRQAAIKYISEVIYLVSLSSGLPYLHSALHSTSLCFRLRFIFKLTISFFFISVCISFPNKKPVSTYALVDCGATTLCISERFATRHSLPQHLKDVPIPIMAVDDHPIASGLIT